MKKIKILKRIKRNLPRVVRSKSLTVIILLVAVFNIIGVKILPNNVVSVYAADINTNELVNLANSERNTRGLNPLIIDSRLINAAKAKGDDMIAKDYWSHYGPNGESPWDFIIATGYEYTYAGENLAKDFSSTVPIHNAWMASPSHRDNIINSNFENIGISLVTGEFQGSETTIVVQMFGTTQVEYSTADYLSESEVSLPETGEKGDLEAPIITDPKDGEILNSGAFTVRGVANEGNEVEIYDNNDVIDRTEIQSSGFVFEKEDDYTEGSHNIYARSYDNDNNYSNYSNYINVTVDTISPRIVGDSLRFEYSEFGSDFKNYIFSVEIEDNPTEVIGKYIEEQINFSYVNDKWQCVINENSEVLGDLKVTASDDAGNEDNLSVRSDELNDLIDSQLLEQKASFSFDKWIVENILSRIMTRSLQGRVNFIIAFIMIILLSIEQLLLRKTGLTKDRSSSLLHLPVFIILIFVGLLGGGGEIL